MSEITQDVAKAVATLQQGLPVALPTETVYGLAALAFNEEAVREVYKLKQRPLNHPLILHVAPEFDLNLWVTNISPKAKKLIKTFWPGPLTLVFKRKQVLDCVTGGQDTVAVRCPLHPMTQKVLTCLGEPLVMPSANPFGKISPTTADHVAESFKDKDLLILDGGRCKLGIESTIVSALEDSVGHIMRKGAIEDEKIHQALKVKPVKASTERVPGQLAQHYQPQKKVFVFRHINELIKTYAANTKPIYVIAFHPLKSVPQAYFFQLDKDPKQVAYELYYQLRIADKSDAAAIYIELPLNDPKWAAINDRILRAASY